MSFFTPTGYFSKLEDIDIDFLTQLNIKTVLLDVDNTISPPGSFELFVGVSDWISKVKKQDINILIASNNYKRRVEPISKIVGVDFIYLSLKPLTLRISKFLKSKRIKKSETLIIGDQIFSDILFANLFGIKSILIEPQIDEKNKITLRIRRKLESFIKCNLVKVKG